MLPILFGAIIGYVVSVPLELVNFSAITNAPLLTAPHITFPNFTGSLSLTAIASIAVMAIATIPESTAHLYQISLYVDKLAEKLGKEKYNLSQFIGFNLILDGIGDAINGLFGGAAGTNYGENNSLMVITQNYSGLSLVVAAVIAILLSFSGTLTGIIQYSNRCQWRTGSTVCVIGMQGIALMVSGKVDLYDPRQLAVGAVIFIIACEISVFLTVSCLSCF